MRCLPVLLLFHFIPLLTPAQDWLVAPFRQKATVTKDAGGKIISLQNGLLSRRFVLQPNMACFGFTHEVNGQQLIRAIEPEAEITINGNVYAIGGLKGQQQKAYFLPDWLPALTAGKNDFQFQDYEVRPLRPLLPERPLRWLSRATTAAGGQELVCRFAHSEFPGLSVFVHYALYDGLPLVSKWVSLQNRGNAALVIGRLKNELLSLVEEESAVTGSTDQMKKQQGLYVETDYAFNNSMRYSLSDQTAHWLADSSYTSQVNYDYKTPCRLEVYPDFVYDLELKAGDNLVSVRSFELLLDSYDRQRRGMAIQRLYQAVAPWTMENPIFMHLVSRNDAEVKSAVDQCAATGYEALILSFGSHLDMEDSSAANLVRWKALADYAHARGIAIGGYSLFSSRRISEADDVINPLTGKTGGAFFGNAPCFGSRWGLAYRDKIKLFFSATGFDIWENDGPYPGDRCASTTHPGHRGLGDSQWEQMKIQKELYRWLYARGVYINAPDWYFLDGTNKIALGYREVNFSLPREDQKILNRQNIFDGTWDKGPSMGWGFVPLTKYQGGGPEAVLEPLSEHLDSYEQLMVQYYGAGVQACYRGPRLYDTDSTKMLVQKIVKWYKQYRRILNAPLVHLRRADGRDWDGWLHTDPQGKQKGFLLLFNPTQAPITRTIRVPLYYTGLKGSMQVREKGAAAVQVRLPGSATCDPVTGGPVWELKTTLPAGGYNWWVIE